MRPSVVPDSTTGRSAAGSFAGDVKYYLTQTPRQLPSRYLYDALGSALFEAICELPWYGITRAEGASSRVEAARSSPASIRFRRSSSSARAAVKSWPRRSNPEPANLITGPLTSVHL